MDEEFLYSLREIADGYLELHNALCHLKKEVELLLARVPVEEGVGLREALIVAGITLDQFGLVDVDMSQRLAPLTELHPSDHLSGGVNGKTNSLRRR